MTPVQLPANKGFRFRTAFFQRIPDAPVVMGILTVEESNVAWVAGNPVVSRYAVTEADCPDGGRLFQVVKPGGTERYWTRIGVEFPSCDCTGNLQHGHCKHVEALTALAARGDLGPNPNEPARVANTNQI